MKKIPIVLEQYECIGCKHKWYINTQDKIDNKMFCPYGCRQSRPLSCEVHGNITRKFDMVINSYEEYAEEERSDVAPTLDDNTDVKEINKDGGD